MKMQTPVNVQVAKDDRSSKPVRLHYLDWLRLIATLGVFIYHAARPFDLQDWMIKNEERTIVVTAVFVVFLGSWGMPLFFMMAGTGSLFSLKRRSAWQFLRERIRRLLLPFIVGSVLLTPLQVYIEYVHKGLYQGSFLGFLPVFIDYLPGPELSEIFNSSIFEAFGIHLWFLGFLFTFSVTALPLFLWMKRDQGKKALSVLASVCEKKGGILLFIIPVALMRFILQPVYPEYTSWADFAYMFVFFIYGFVIYANERFITVIRRDWRMLLGVGILSTVVIFAAAAAGVGLEWYSNSAIPGFYIAWGLISINAWCWVTFALYFGQRYLDRRNNLLEYGQEAILPFYVFHQPVIFVIVYYVVQWDAGILPKLVIVTLGAFVITGAIHELVVKRIPPLRLLFGMKPGRTTAQPGGAK
jgi:peptidoglycan/LPS O-acetylase OafA/YrhL